MDFNERFVCFLIFFYVGAGFGWVWGFSLSLGVGEAPLGGRESRVRRALLFLPGPMFALDAGLAR